jgi:hypothetical protein
MRIPSRKGYPLWLAITVLATVVILGVAVDQAG